MTTGQTKVGVGDPTEEADDRLGLVLGDKYRIDSLIGRGGMGRVYRATHVSLGEPVAVKFLLGMWSRTPELRARFRREAVALARLRHPSIVSLLDFGEHRDEPYMVMELVDGLCLADRIAPTEPSLTFPVIGEVFDQILQVLEAAHAKGIVHRDLKPENVMLVVGSDRAARIKILDFGLAMMDEGNDVRLTDTGTTHGTPLYMSPEQCRGHDVGAPTDIYAVGVMLYECLTGVCPFDGGDAASIMAQQMFVDPAPMESVGYKRAVPGGYVEVVRAALQKRAGERPSAAELRDLLRQAISGTDPATLAANAAAARARASALSRSERAFTGRVDPPSARTIDGSTIGRTVALCVSKPEALRDALAVRGLVPRIVELEALLGGASSSDAVVIEAKNAATQLPLLRRAMPRLPVLVIRADATADGPALVRNGASDVAPEDRGEDGICRQVQRLIRRGR